MITVDSILLIKHFVVDLVCFKLQKKAYRSVFYCTVSFDLFNIEIFKAIPHPIVGNHRVYLPGTDCIRLDLPIDLLNVQSSN